MIVLSVLFCFVFLVILDNSLSWAHGGKYPGIYFALHLTELSFRSKRFLCEKDVHVVQGEWATDAQEARVSDCEDQLSELPKILSADLQKQESQDYSFEAQLYIREKP